MKNNYALDFAPDRVTLLSGKGKKQAPLGEIAFDDPHFGTRLEDLRKEVEAETGAPLAPTLLIPHSEVLFHTMKVEESADDDARAKAVASELAGMTPYAVEDLVFDWKSNSKTQIQVAAVARDTLDEADDFAAQHGFGPGQFSTAAKAGAFKGQPDFGQSSRPVPEVQPAIAPAPEAAPVADTAPDSKPVEADAATDTASTPDAKVDAQTGVAADMVPSDKTTDVPVTTAKDEVAKLATAATDSDTPASPAKPLEAKAESPPETKSDTAQPKTKAGAAQPEPKADTAQAKTKAETASGPASKPNAADAASKTAPAGPVAPPKSESSTPKTPPTPAAAAEKGNAGGFASRRTAQNGGKKPSEAESTRLGDIASRIAMLPDGGAGPKGNASDSTPDIGPAKSTAAAAKKPLPVPTGKGAAPRRAPGPGAPTPTVRRVDPPKDTAAPKPGDARPKPALSEAEAMTVFGMRDTGRSPLAAFLPVLLGLAVAVILAVVIWSIFFFLNPSEQVQDAPVSDPVIAAVPPQGTADDATPALPGDMAGVTPDEVIPPGPNSDSVDEVAPGAEPDTQFAALPEAEAPTPVAEDPTEPVAEDVPPETDVAPEIAATDDTTPEPEAQPEPETAPEPEQAALPPLPDDPLRRSAGAPEETRYAATGVSTSIPSAPEMPSTSTADVDAAPISDTTVELRETVPQPSAPNLVAFTAPGALLPPPAPGTRFNFGPDGRIEATPDGSLTPQGVTVTAGPPAVVPPPAPNRPAPTQPVEAPADAATPDVQTEGETPLQPTEQPETEESTLSIPVTEGRPAVVPPARPTEDQATLAVPTPDQASGAAADQAVEATRVALGGTALTSLSGITPRPRSSAIATPAVVTTEEPLVPTRVALMSPPPARPGGLTPDTAEPDAAQAAETAATIAAILPDAIATPEPVVATSPYAVASSLLPVGRPRNLAERAAAQRAQRQQRQRQQAAPVQVATAAAVVTPRNPTRGSVASRATEPNKIKLNAVNLIGVYGTQSNRRALVRLPSGRFVKVKVGDRVDGGRVSAIGADALRYEKRGRSLTLQMPSG